MCWCQGVLEVLTLCLCFMQTYDQEDSGGETGSVGADNREGGFDDLLGTGLRRNNADWATAFGRLIERRLLAESCLPDQTCSMWVTPKADDGNNAPAKSAAQPIKIARDPIDTESAPWQPGLGTSTVRLPRRLRRTPCRLN